MTIAIHPDGRWLFANKKPSSKSDRVEYDFDRSDTLAVPRLELAAERVVSVRGHVWYKTDIPVELRRSSAVRLLRRRQLRPKVYLNGKLAARMSALHVFNVELTDLLRPKDNFLVVKSTTSGSVRPCPRSTRIGELRRAHRDVLLVEVPQTFIRDYSLQAKKAPRIALRLGSARRAEAEQDVV